MSKFEHIRKGDEVLVPKSVLYDWGHSKEFMVLDTIVRTTKTQAVTNTGVRFQKKDGFAIGGKSRSFVRYPNEEHKDYLGRSSFYTDQTEEMRAFKRKLVYCRSIMNMSNELTKECREINHNNYTIDELDDLLRAIKETLIKVKKEKDY